MPELPDITVYVEHLERRLLGARLEQVRIGGINLLRTAEPPVETLEGRVVRGFSRVGKRIAIGFEGGLFAVFHLMIAGRLHWRTGAAEIPRRTPAVLRFDRGTLWLTEAGTKQRASLHVVEGREQLEALGAGGIEPLEASLEEFAAAVTREDHTLKRTLTDPRLLSGIGNAYSDEILHRARLSPLRRTPQLAAGEIERLWRATREILLEWTARLREETGEAFPEHVTAFREAMAVHGKYGKPCPVCGAPVQRIVRAENETNYCARCQTGGRVLADRALSRLLHGDWPRTIEELEEGRAGPAAAGSPPASASRARRRR